MHPRITSNPARANGLAEFIRYAQSKKDAVFMRRDAIARKFIEQVPRPATPADRPNR